MATETTRASEHVLSEERETAETVFGGTLIAGVLTVGVIAVSIIGLVGLAPHLLLAVAVLALGVAFLFEGGSIMAGLSELPREMAPGRPGLFGLDDLSLGVTAESLAGMAGAVLGVIAILNISVGTVVPAAAIVFGSALILGAGANARLGAMRTRQSERRRDVQDLVQDVARQFVLGATSLYVLAGLAVITLGILALQGINPLVLSQAAMLTIAALFVLSDAAIATRMFSLFHRS
jgi:hypothetical protein